MNPQYKSREIGHLLADSDARAVVALADLVPFVEEVVSVSGAAEGATPFEGFLADHALETVEREDDDDAVQPYTPGTTGQQYCLTNLAEYKYPREVEFVEELPRTTTGKVQKFKLVDEEVGAE